MGRIVAIGGGTFEEIDELNRAAVRLSGKAVPNVLFIGTALQDSTNPLTSCKKSFKRVCPGCIVKKLSIIRSSYTEEEIDALLDWSDVIFVGGGNTAYMMEEWRKIGLDRKLREIFDEDKAVLSGISAGAVCWFKVGYTDSAMFSGNEDWEYGWIRPGIDLIDMAVCPHYNDPKRSGFPEALRKLNDENGTELAGVALTDRSAMVVNGSKITFLSAGGAEECAENYTIVTKI